MKVLKIFYKNFLCISSRIYLKIRLFYLKIDKWHINATYYCRPYKKKIVKLANLINADTVIEIGCGLGEISSRIRSKKIFGIDVDPLAIKAAEIINSGPIYINMDPLKDKKEFLSFLESLPKNEKKLFIAVNWLHSFKNDEVLEFTNEINKLSNSYLLIDRYSRAELSKFGGSNKFDHAPEKLFNSKKYISFDFVDEVRDLILVQNF